MPKVELANIEYGHSDGRKTALVRFAVTTDATPLPCVQDFNVEVFLWDNGDPSGTAAEARAELQRLISELAKEG